MVALKPLYIYRKGIRNKNKKGVSVTNALSTMLRLLEEESEEAS